MNTLNKRQNDIITYLSKLNDYITIKNISNMFNISERTVRNDLDSIEYVLNKYNIDLDRKPRLGIKLNGDEKEIENILGVNSNSIYTSSERMRIILLIMIIKNRTTFEELAEELGVSKNTIVQDTKNLEEKLTKGEDIFIEKRSYYGIHLDGNEEKIRNCFLKLYKGSSINIRKKTYRYLIEYLRINNIKSFIENVENLVDVKYSEEALEELEIMIYLLFSRIKNNKCISYSDEYINTEKKNKNYLVIEECLNKISNTVSDCEKCYLLKLFSGAKSTLGKFISENAEVDKISTEIIQDIFNVINIKIEDNLDLEEQMNIHLKVAIYRIKNNLLIDNPMLDEIKYKLSFVYTITEKILKKYEKPLDIRFPEAEIAYIALYFDALFEKNYKNKNLFRVLIVCNGGLATSSLLKSRIASMIQEIKVVDICRLKDLDSYLKTYEIDFIITTVPITLNEYKVIKVNPLLELDDIEKIKAELFNREYEKKCEFLVKKVENKEHKIITKILPEKYSKLGLSIDNWKEAIKTAAEPLIKDRKIEKQYVSEIIKTIETLGNYMVFIPEIAFVHAEPTYVIENSVSILVLNKAIKFGSKNQVDVKVIVVLANKNENMNLVNLVNIITKEGNINKLKEAKNYKDLEAIK